MSDLPPSELPPEDMQEDTVIVTADGYVIYPEEETLFTHEHLTPDSEVYKKAQKSGKASTKQSDDSSARVAALSAGPLILGVLFSALSALGAQLPSF